MARKLIEIRDLLSELDVDASVSITSPAKVARELFTHQGSGTLVRMGTPIVDLKGGDNSTRPKPPRFLNAALARR